jgi:hypothetical protein
MRTLNKKRAISVIFFSEYAVKLRHGSAATIGARHRRR